jgi:hypothetical protein
VLGEVLRWDEDGRMGGGRRRHERKHRRGSVDDPAVEPQRDRLCLLARLELGPPARAERPGLLVACGREPPTVRWASSPYCACGTAPFGAGSGRNCPAAVSSAQSGGSSRPPWVNRRVSDTAAAARRCHLVSPVSVASPRSAGKDQ